MNYSLKHYGVYFIILLLISGMVFFVLDTFIFDKLLSLSLSLVFSLWYLASLYVSHKKFSNLVKLNYIISNISLAAFLKIFILLFILSIISQTLSFSPPFLLYLFTLLTGIVLTLIGVAISQQIKVRELEIRIQDLPEWWHGKKIVFISDLHIGQIYGRKFLKRTIDIINSLNPETVLIGGDLFDGSLVEFEKELLPLNDLRSTFGTYYVTGNHEYFVGIDYVKKILNKISITWLDNQVININQLYVIGVSHSLSEKDFNFERKIEKIYPQSKDLPAILIYHEPNKKDTRVAERKGIDLQLSGHTHSGQMFPFNLLTKMIYGEYDYGLHERNNFSQYTSSGLGTWGPPVKTSAYPEIALITLLSKDSRAH